MEELLEGKKIDSEYEKEWNEIPRETFDKIVVLDPQTNLEGDKIGPSTKQLLLPRFVEGEVDFLDKAEEVTKALTTYLGNRGSYPQPLRNIANFPTVKDFIEYITLGDESEFAKSHDFSDFKKEEKPKETKLDTIYKKYYEDKIERESFNKIISLDPETTESSIGQTAKNLLLPRAISGEDFSDYYDDLPDIILKFNSEKDSYPEDKRAIEKFPSVKEFVQYVSNGPETEFVKYLKNDTRVDRKTGNMVKDDIVIIGSTPKYDIIQPLSWAANSAITTDPVTHKRYISWCTGWAGSNGSEDRSQWENHFSREWIYCFIDKNNPKPTNERQNQSSYQLAIKKSDDQVYQFLDGNDKCYGSFNDTNTKNNENFFRDFLKGNLDVCLILSKTEHLKNNKIVKEVVQLIKYKDKPFIYNGPESLNEFKEYQVKDFVKEIIVEGIEKIPNGAFSECAALQTLTLKEGLKEIGYEAFMKCIKLNNIAFPETLEKIDAEAFAQCTSLKNTIKIPNSLTYIGREAFRGTHCKLSIDKKRETKLKFNAADRDWVVSHVKAITVQEGLSEDMDINEEILDEKIPFDLARAYKKSQEAVNGIQSHPRSAHGEVGGNNRRSVNYDYDKATYEEISKQEAIDYLGLSVNVLPDRDEHGKIVAKVRTTDREGFNEKISNLRFIIDGKVIEYEVRNGNVLYLAYWMDIPDRYFTDYPKFKGKEGYATTDCRFANKYSDIYTIIQIADKIYKTDEYEHEINDDTPTGKKIKKLRVDSEGNPVKDEEGNLVYDIVDDTIVDRRARNSVFKTIRTLIGRDNPEYLIHNPADNLRKTSIPSEVDTGAHDVSSSIRGLYSLPYDQKQKFIDYFEMVKLSKKLFRQYDYIRSYIKKVESEREYYEEDEYNELMTTLKAQKEEKYNQYLESKKRVKELKSKVVTSIDDVVLNINKRFSSNVELLDKYLKDLYKNSQEQASLSLKVVTMDSEEKNAIDKRIKKQEEEIEAQQKALEELKRRKEEFLRAIEELKTQIEQGTIDLEQAFVKLNEIKSQLDEVSETVMKNKFKKLDELKAERDRLQAELNALSPRSAADKAGRASKNKEKELDSDLLNIIEFESTEDEIPA